MYLEGVLEEKQLGPNSPGLAAESCTIVLRQFPYDINGDSLHQVLWCFLESRTQQFIAEFVI